MSALALLFALAAGPPDLAAVGVVLARSPERSVAILRAGGKTRVVAVGESAFGGRLVSVGLETVTLEFEGQRVGIRLQAAAPAPAPAPPASLAAGSRPALPPGSPPVDPATPHRSMNRVEVQRRLGEEIPRILAETAVVPVTEEGRVVGLQVTRMPEGSLLTDAGLRPGDVVTRINDVQIDGMATLIGLWPRLQNARDLRAVVLRGGQPVSLAVTLR
jgi:type II secretion system protein C